MPLAASALSAVTKKRLGLASWLVSLNVRQGPPMVLGAINATAEIGAFYPFPDNDQQEFVKDVAKDLQKAFKKGTPVFVRCGSQTCCDYLYLFVRVDATGTKQWVGFIADAKHTGQVDGGKGDSVTAADQKRLFEALVAVNTAIGKATAGKLSHVRLLFVTNRSKWTKSKDPTLLRAKSDAESLLPGVKLELLNQDTFDFGPFSDFLFARREQALVAKDEQHHPPHPRKTYEKRR